MLRLVHLLITLCQFMAITPMLWAAARPALLCFAQTLCKKLMIWPPLHKPLLCVLAFHFYISLTVSELLMKLKRLNYCLMTICAQCCKMLTTNLTPNMLCVRKIRLSAVLRRIQTCSSKAVKLLTYIMIKLKALFRKKWINSPKSAAVNIMLLTMSALLTLKTLSWLWAPVPKQLKKLLNI